MNYFNGSVNINFWDLDISNGFMNNNDNHLEH